MAQVIRNAHELAAIRILLRPSRSGLELSFASFIGAEELERRDVPAELVGLQSELCVSAYRGARFEIPERVLQPIVGSLLARAAPDEPCWLQVGSSAGHLGVVPWERYFQPALGRPLLRIPNFLADPVFLGERLQAALVISSPRAKTPFSVEQYTHALVAAAQQAVPQGTELHVFADSEAQHGLQSLPAPAGHAVIVHDPRKADSYGQGGTDFAPRGIETRLQSPWLHWIRGATGGESLDLVHFVCPGFFRRDQGALALARSPSSNEDQRWSHFVGADELMVLLDLVGAWSVGFSPPYENVWAIGLRLLADRLAWQRPGPLFVHDSEHGTPQDLSGVYRFLYASNDEEPPSCPNLALYSHPRRMERYRTSPVDAYESMRPCSMASVGEAMPEQLVQLARKEDRGAQAARTRPRSAWVQANGLQLDRMLMKVGPTDTPDRRGALAALEWVRGVFEHAGSAAGMPPPAQRRSQGEDEGEEHGQAMGTTSA